MIDPPLPTAVYRYWACDLRTGNKLAQLPLAPSGDLPDRISDVSTAAFTCDLAAVWADGGDFKGMTTPGRSVIIVEREHEGDSTSDILWAGIVLPRKTGSNPQASVNCASIASYLGRRFVGTHTYNAGPGETDTQIITDLMADAAPEGIDFILDVDCPTPRAVRYMAIKNQSVLSALKDLSDMDGGPEWTVVTRWSDTDRLAVDFVLLARPRLGWAEAPNIRFDFPGSITEYSDDEDFTEGHGANHLRAVTNAGASSVPVRDEEALSQGFPRWEEVVQTSGDLDAPGLLGVAKGAKAKRARGQSTLSLTVSMSAGPQLGRDWVIGDNARFFVAGPAAAGEAPPSLSDPDGRDEVHRTIGVALNIPNDTMTPILWSPYDDEDVA